MQRALLALSVAALAFAASTPTVAQVATNTPAATLQAPAPDYGPLASDEQGTGLLKNIEAKFGGVMRSMYGWTDWSFQRLYSGYKNYPVSVLKSALAAPTYEAMMGSFNEYTTYAHQRVMAKAFPGPKAYSLSATAPGEENDPLVVQAKQQATKALGDTAKDLVFVPITPCTTWDTRFGIDSNANGTITNGNTKSFQTFLFGTDGDFSVWGGNPSCAQANAGTIGGNPVAAMMIVYINNASANGWLTFYRYADPDPSQATISVYYAPGPTRTQTVISKVNGGAYDVSATSRFGNTDASASVVGYFMQSPATPLDCTIVVGNGTAAVATDTGVTLPACTTGYTRAGGYCYGAAATSNNMYLLETGPNGCVFRNLSGSTTYSIHAVSNCCRVPGR